MARRPVSTVADDPLWYKDAVIYQLHVKSFYDSNDDGIGDFRGLLQKLDYIADLGVDTIWLLPFYPSPRRDDGYDISAYRAVHPDYGTLSDVRDFIAAAHARGIRVVTELVINHTSDQHPWFQRARRAKPGSIHRDFYVWSDSDQKFPETRIIFLDTEKSNWTWDPVAGAYFWHRFYSHQPDLNFDNPRVLEAVLRAMRFWLDLGVDGLRLDAIPYLVEREGTNNENLPETHEILKRIRADLDARFHNRMLLAEANQWPEDTQEYFGRGDECHMAFHFPLMPRMYMAIAQEDRFPITDILRQTPDIPENCQWAIFLRNHDELTLEMVTETERTFLWDTYAADRRARINLGIRRRLSPLLERDRRRMELMTSLLFTMPGTPVLYYGDEIGMGDNIHLGDRDGVRTPMQWSPDRNGGFSRADPERLVLPSITNPLYGYTSVNVEAQQRDPHSLLNWTKRMLRVRRQYHAFGRGTLRFLYPGNRKVLAYLREDETTVILCVANLSRAPQAVELELSQFAGRVPVELTGNSVFPPIGQLTYLLTLPAYGFYLFELREAAEGPSWHTDAPEPMPDYVTLVLRGGLGGILDEPNRGTLEREILPEYLRKRRWFGAKDEVIDAVRIASAIPLPGAEEILLCEIEVDLAGRCERYHLPLGIAWEGRETSSLPLQMALARVRRGPRVGHLTDGFALEAMAHALIGGLRSGSGGTGEVAAGLSFVATGAFGQIEIPADAPIRWLSAEQSNSSLILGEEAVIKLIRRVTEGIHPEGEMTRHLTEAGYANTPALLGEVVREAADGDRRTVAVVQRFVRNQGDGWTFALDHLTRALEARRGGEEDRFEEALAGYGELVGAVGRRLAELHAVLARPNEDAAFAPERADSDHVAWLAARACREVEGALDSLAAGEGWPDDDSRQASQNLIAIREDLLSETMRLAHLAAGELLTRVHGDFHLGQVLVAMGDAFIIDFEGEPARSLAERRRKDSPLRDVAGLLRSLHYAVSTAAGAPGTASEEDLDQVQLARIHEDATTSFLGAYRETAAAHGLDVTGPGHEPLLTLFLVEKAAYEVRYEAANRPAWIGVPTRGLAELVRDLLGRKGEGDGAG